MRGRKVKQSATLSPKQQATSTSSTDDPAELDQLFDDMSTLKQMPSASTVHPRYLVSDELGNLFAIVSFLKAGDHPSGQCNKRTLDNVKNGRDWRALNKKSSTSTADFKGKIKSPFLRLSHRSCKKVAGKLGVRIVPVPGTWEGTSRSYICPIDELDELCCRVDIDYASTFVPQIDSLVHDDFSIRFDDTNGSSPQKQPLLSSKRSLVMPKPRQRQVLDELCLAVADLPRKVTQQNRKLSVRS